MSKILAGEVKLAEYARRTFRVTPPAGTKLEELLDPSYWAHVAPQFAQYDSVEVVAQDGAYYAELLVVSCSKVHARMVVLQEKRLGGAVKKDAGIKAPFVVEFKGPQRKWSIIRAADKQYVKEGLDSREAADGWLAENIQDLQ